MNQTSAIQILCDATIKASLMILDSKGINTKSIDTGKLAADLRETMKAELGTVLSEWKEAVEANMGEGWLREIMNTQANWIAAKALKNNNWIS